MKRDSLKKNIGNKIRFNYAKVENFSIIKNNKYRTYNNKILFEPTLLLTDLYTQYNDGKKINIDHKHKCNARHHVNHAG